MPKIPERLMKLKPMVMGIVLVLLSMASMLSFLSLGLIVSLYFMSTISYSLIFWVTMCLAISLFLSQLIPGYFSEDKRYMLVPLIFSTALIGVLFTMLLGYKGVIYGASCALGNLVGFYFREKR